MARPSVRARRTASGTRLLRLDRTRCGGRLAGADEAGRGSLAGPLVAAAVCLDLAALSRAARRDLAGLDDSKRLTAAAREEVAQAVLAHACQVAVASASAPTIDRDGLHRTNLRLLRRVLAAIHPPPELAIVDGFALGPDAPPHRALVGGDASSAAVAAASVVAKTVRDRLMRGPVADAYPGFGFDRHVGYGTPAHQAALRAAGPCAVHRLSFRSAAYTELRLFEA